MTEPDNSQPQEQAAERAQEGDKVVYVSPPLFKRVYYATVAGTIKSVLSARGWYSGWYNYFYPPSAGPNIVKAYDVRPDLPIRIFFPSSYDQTSPQTLPTLFTIHGGGFTLGQPADDDIWNRTFADAHSALVVALNYAKAPAHPFPAGLRDVEALYLAAASDESLPIDRERVGVAGFSAGGNLALGLCQLPQVRAHEVKIKAVAPVYPPLDFSIAPEVKGRRRYYKKGMRGGEYDWVLPLAPVFDWANITPGQDLRDPLLSPFYAKREDLPGHVFVVAAELDFLVCEARQFALRLAGKEGDPACMYEAIPGRSEMAARKGELELKDEMFSWEVSGEDGKSGVRWLLVPDVVHAFDFHSGMDVASDEVSRRDAEAKTRAYIEEMGRWMLEKAWA